MREIESVATLLLQLPYPPSVNTYWGFHGHRRFLTKKANEFKDIVKIIVLENGAKFGNNLLSIDIKLYPPDKRIRDIDNNLKPLFDSLVQAGLMDDDSQIRRISVEFQEVFKGGKVELEIKTLPDLQKP